MRAEQYERQLDAVTDYIYAHLADNLNLEILAHVSGFSRYHWHRIYRAVRGETVAQTVRRLRLERAGSMLTETSWSLERIARRTGFGSAEVLARAFLRSYGMSPARFRAAGGAHGRTDQLIGGENAGSTPLIDERPSWPVNVRERAGYRLVVAEHRGSYMDIGRAFARVTDRMGGRGIMVAIYPDDPDTVPQEALRSVAGTVVDSCTEAPDGLTVTDVPAGRYAVMRYTGPYALMHAAYLQLYGQWLPSSGEQPQHHPVVEEYLTDPVLTPPTQAVTNILLPLA